MIIHRNDNHASLQQQRGVVIVVALFIVALVATMAYWMVARLERDTRRTTLIVRDVQADLYAQGSVIWAMDQLRNNWELKKPDQVVDNLPLTSPAETVNGYTISSTIYDMQARFNINTLTNKDAQTQFKLFLHTLNPAMPTQDITNLVQAIVDWITPGAQSNAFNQYYAELPLPYRAAHVAMMSPSELRLVKGITPAIYNQLQPLITTLSDANAQINVQTAPPEVLMLVSPLMTADVAKAVVTLRTQKPFLTTEDFTNADPIKNRNITATNITVLSSYFLVETHVTLENQHLVLYTLLQRVTKDKKAVVNIVWQSKGTW